MDIGRIGPRRGPMGPETMPEPQDSLEHLPLPDDGTVLLRPAHESLIARARGETGEGSPWVRQRLEDANAALGAGDARGAASSFESVREAWPNPLASMAAGAALVLASDWRGARALLCGSADQLEERGLLDAALGCRLNLGYVHYVLGDPAAAESTLDRAVEAARRAGRTRLLATGLHEKAVLRLRHGRYRDARQECDRALAECAGERPELAQVMSTHGIASQALGEFPRAEKEFRSSLSLASGASPFAELRASVNLALLCQLTARGTEALELLAAATAIAERQGDARFLAKLRFLRALMDFGEIGEEALPAALAEIEQMRSLHYRKGELDAIPMLVPCLLECGKSLEAETLAAAAVSAAEESGYLAGLLEAMSSAALVHLAGADAGRAREAASGVLEKSEAAGLPLVAVKARRVLADASLQEGEPERALEHLRRAERAAAELGAQVLQCHLMEGIAGLLEIRGRIDEAEAERAAAQARALSIGVGRPIEVGNE